jgi:hypothetical protein
MDFAPYQLGEMINPNLVVKSFTFIFGHFVFSATFSNVHPAQLTLSPIYNHKIKYENIFSKIKMIMAPIICKNSCNSFKM